MNTKINTKINLIFVLVFYTSNYLFADPFQETGKSTKNLNFVNKESLMNMNVIIGAGEKPFSYAMLDGCKLRILLTDFTKENNNFMILSFTKYLNEYFVKIKIVKPYRKNSLIRDLPLDLQLEGSVKLDEKSANEILDILQNKSLLKSSEIDFKTRNAMIDLSQDTYVSLKYSLDNKIKMVDLNLTQLLRDKDSTNTTNKLSYLNDSAKTVKLLLNLLLKHFNIEEPIRK